MQVIPLPSAPRSMPMSDRTRLLHALAMILLFTVLVRWIGQAILAPAIGMIPAGISIVALQIAMVWLGVVRLGRIGWRELGWRFGPGPRLAVDAALGVAGALLVCAGLLLVIVPAGGGDAGETLARIAGYSTGERMLFLFIGLQASFIEESLFRGYLQPILSRPVGAAAAWILTAIVFGVSHLSFHPLRLAGITFIGLVYGALRLGDRSLVAPSVAHTLTWAIFGFA